MEPGGGHRSGAGSGGAGSNKCTKGANGKHNTKIDKILKHEGDDAKECLRKQNDCNNQSERENTGGARTGKPPDGPPDHADNQEEPEEDEDEDDEEEEEEEDDEEEEEEEDTEATGDTH